MLCKIFLLALLVVVVVAVVPDPNETAEEAWPKYKKDHDRSYDAEEDAKRFAVFKKKYDQIVEHNKRHEAGEVTWTAGLNQFTDRFPEELEHLNGLKRPEGASR
ncbi:cathepsin L-like proteinase isoform X3 [Diabrotica virgifera virgifera]|uniref:Cathepsin propeptide inhibitor domain-containing protein n=1 Tax=Diabrotica virgifera virgifera TaxID=50390 RepID=A0ABM5L4V7_DIAVI|nr:cathepsin L-like proteinase isoform X3 [Diabrotica virgifera virgifera]